MSHSFLLTTAVLATLFLSGCGGDSSGTTGPTTSAPPSPSTVAEAPTEAPAPAQQPGQVRANQNGQSPIIKGWVATRNRTTVILALDTYDPQGDLFGGFTSIQIKNQPGVSQALSGPINRLLRGSNPNNPENNVYLYAYSPAGIPSGIPIQFTVTVTDRTGHRSNRVSGFFVTEDKAGESVDGPMPQLELQGVEVGQK